MYLTYRPSYLHFLFSSSSSLSATPWSTPTTTSALFVRRLKIGNEPARGPIAFSKGVEAGHRMSPVSLFGRHVETLEAVATP